MCACGLIIHELQISASYSYQLDITKHPSTTPLLFNFHIFILTAGKDVCSGTRHFPVPTPLTPSTTLQETPSREISHIVTRNTIYLKFLITDCFLNLINDVFSLPTPENFILENVEHCGGEPEQAARIGWASRWNHELNQSVDESCLCKTLTWSDLNPLCILILYEPAVDGRSVAAMTNKVPRVLQLEPSLQQVANAALGQ